MTETASQVAQLQMVTRSTSGIHRSPSIVPPGHRRLGTQRARQARAGRKWLERRKPKAAASSQALQNQRVVRPTSEQHRSITATTPQQHRSNTRETRVKDDLQTRNSQSSQHPVRVSQRRMLTACVARLTSAFGNKPRYSIPAIQP